MAEALQVLRDGDTGWSGVNLRMDPRQLPVGIASGARNCRFTDGTPTTRLGVIKPICAHLTPGTQPLAWPDARGVGNYRDPDSQEWTFIVSGNQVWRFREGNVPVEVEVTVNALLDVPCFFVPAFNKLYLFRGTRRAPLVLDDFDAGFERLHPVWLPGGVYTQGELVSCGAYVSVVKIEQVTESSGVTYTKVTTASDHGIREGEEVWIGGTMNYDGVYACGSPSADTFYIVAGAHGNETPAGATATNHNAVWERGPDDNGSNGGYVAGDMPGYTSHVAAWTRIYNALPGACAAVFVSNRLVCATDYTPNSAVYDTTATRSKPDFLVAASYGDPLRFEFYDQFRINQGDSGEIVDLVKFTDDQVMVFKTNSWHILTGLGQGVADLSTVLALATRGESYGATCRGAATVAGADVVWVAGPHGIVSAAQTATGKTQGTDVPVSRDLEPLLKRVNWQAARTTARVAYDDNKLYVALPIDGASTNNIVAVYDYLQGAWAGWDDGDEIRVKEFFRATYLGKDRLWFLDTSGWLNVYEVADAGDQAVTDGVRYWEDIEFDFTSRGYLGSQWEWNRPAAVKLLHQTLNPYYTVSAVREGANEADVVIDGRTKNYLRYVRPFDAAEWDPTNVNDDFHTAYREDYTAALKPVLYLGDNGVTPGLMQESEEEFRVNRRAGNLVQIRIVNNVGRYRLRALQVEGLKVGTGKGTRV